MAVTAELRLAYLAWRPHRRHGFIDGYVERRTTELRNVKVLDPEQRDQLVAVSEPWLRRAAAELWVLPWALVLLATFLIGSSVGSGVVIVSSLLSVVPFLVWASRAEARRSAIGSTLLALVVRVDRAGPAWGTLRFRRDVCGDLRLIATRMARCGRQGVDSVGARRWRVLALQDADVVRDLDQLLNLQPERGRRLLATTVGGMAELVSHGRVGEFRAPGDVQPLVRAGAAAAGPASSSAVGMPSGWDWAP